MRKAIVPLLAVVAFSVGCSKAPQSQPVVNATEAKEEVTPAKVEIAPLKLESSEYQALLKVKEDAVPLKQLPEWKESVAPEISWLSDEIKAAVKEFNFRVNVMTVAIDGRKAANAQGRKVWSLLQTLKAYTENASANRKDVEKIKAAVAAKQTYIGMPWWALLVSAGEPTDMRRTRTTNGEKIEWVYRDGPIKYANIENGVVTAIQD